MFETLSLVVFALFILWVGGSVLSVASGRVRRWSLYRRAYKGGSTLGRRNDLLFEAGLFALLGAWTVSAGIALLAEVLS